MALRKPLVVVSGQIQQLASSDTLDATIQEKGILTLINGESSPVVIGTPVYVSAVNTVKKAEGNASGTTNVIGLVANTSIAASASGSVQTDGILTATTTQWDAVAGTTGGLVFGTVYYLDPATAGQITGTAPTTSGQYIAPVGTALSTTDLDISIGQTILL